MYRSLLLCVIPDLGTVLQDLSDISHLTHAERDRQPEKMVSDWWADQLVVNVIYLSIDR